MHGEYQNFEFSRSDLSSVSGNASNDRDYLEKYCRHCTEKIREACRAILTVTEGRASFDENTVPRLNAHVLQLRFFEKVLLEGKQQFHQDSKSGERRIFENALNATERERKNAKNGAVFFAELIKTLTP